MKYPSIENARRLDTMLRRAGVKSVTFAGTTKVHGTNARITYTEDNKIIFGQRNVDNIQDGHYGFVEWARQNAQHLSCNMERPYTIFGEWAGQGIQAGVPYPKSFLIFGVCEKETEWWNDSHVTIKSHAQNVHRMSSFGLYWTSWTEDEGFDSEGLVELINNIEACCPVANQLGYPNSVGEGVVFVPSYSIDMRDDADVSKLTELYYNPEWGFKIKGEKHSVSSSDQFKKQLDPSIPALALSLVTDARYYQGVGELGIEFDKRFTGQFVKWVQADVEKEEGDLFENAEHKKAVLKQVGNNAARWFVVRGNGITITVT